jgi:DNA invertase Pin-like site-specific DNA recombinase
MRIGYGRVSLADMNPDAQRLELEAAECDRIYLDKGTSGAATSRPELDRMLEALRPGDTVVITELSRMGRSVRHLHELLERFQDLGVSLRVLRQGIDTTTSEGRFLFAVIAAAAAFERDLLRERTKAGMAAARAQGKLKGRPAKLTKAQIAKAKRMHAELLDDGARRYTSVEIAGALGVGRSTLYRALRNTTTT